MERCPRCGKSKGSGEQGRITQWVAAGCLCDHEPLVVDQDDHALFCAKCNLRIAEKKAGRLTQWIFSSHHCQCAQPEPTASASRAANPKVAPPVAVRESSHDEQEIPVDPNAFPLDRYIPLKEIGAGAGGMVYLSRDRLLKKKVAIKCLKTLTADHFVSLQREAKAIGHLQHPNIVTVLDFGSTNGSAPYMVLDYVKGTTIEKIIQETAPLSVDAAITVIKQTASGLAHAHNKGIFHRDIKSSNILVVDRSQDDTGSQNLKVKIVDFGLATAKHLNQEPTIMHGRTIVGTPAYMPPDQALGYSYDERSEMYALGCVFFEALTGVPPYQGETALATISMHAHQPTPALFERNSNRRYPAALEAVIAKCLAKERDERFQSMEELIEALGSLNTRTVMTQEVFKPVLATTGGFVLPSDSAIQDPGDTTRRSTNGGYAQTAIGISIALSIVGLAMFAINQMMQRPQLEVTSKLGSIGYSSEDVDPISGSLEVDHEKRSSRGGSRDAVDRELRALEKRNSFQSGKLLSSVGEAYILAPRITTRDGVTEIQNGNDDLVKEELQKHKCLSLRITGGSFSKNGFAELANAAPKRLTFESFEISNPEALGSLADVPSVEHIEFIKCDNSLGLLLKNAARLPNLKIVEVRRCSSRDAEFDGLKNFKKLENLNLTMLPNFSGAGLKYLSGLPIKELNMSFLSSLSDKSLAHIRGLSRLNTLGIYHCPDIQGESFVALKDLPLVGFRPVGLPLTKHGFENIAQIKSLRALSIELFPHIITQRSDLVDIAYLRATYYKYEDGSFKALRALPNLESIVLNADLFYPGASADLAAFPQLKEVDLLTSERVATSLFTPLSACEKLETLMLFGHGVDSYGWQMIGRMNKLRNLGTFRSGITDADVQQIAKLKLSKLLINSQDLTEEGFLDLRKMTTLKTFEFQCPQITNETVDALRRDMPGATIRQGCTYRNYAPVAL